MISTVTSCPTDTSAEREDSVQKGSNGLHTTTTTPTPATASVDRDIESSPSSCSRMLRFLWSLFRLIFLDGGLTILFAAFVFASVVHKLHDDYLYPQLQLMLFQRENRDLTDTTYFYRICDERDFTATTPEELMIEDDFTTEDCVEHMLTHGASVYPNLLSNETATELRDWIAQENHKRETWGVIENENRYSWGIDINQHPKLQDYWKELASNDKLRPALEAIVGPDPAIIEFTAITSSYGATDQYTHADVIPSASAVKYARSFVPSYSLFIPLQDTTYAMGSTHVCPGSHLCADAEEECNDHGAFAVSGEEEDDFWPMGTGALLNQQTFHKGMGYTQRGGIDRVLLIATFAPRPNYRNGIESRQIGQGGSYSLLWHQWGHTLSDYVHADKRMTEPQKTFRSLGLIRGNGWNYLSVLSMRMANEDTEMRADNLEELLEDEGGLSFLPRSWQDYATEPSDISEYHAFAIQTLKRVRFELGKFYGVALGVYIAAFGILVLLQRALGLGKVSKQSKTSIALRLLLRFAILHGVVLCVARLALDTVDDSHWARSIRSRKLFRIPVTESDNPAPATIPHQTDILAVPQYSSDYMASYARVIEYAHPGNSLWKEVTTVVAPLYTALALGMKGDYCANLLHEVLQGRRFLKQDEERFWMEITSPKELFETCDRDLTLASDPILQTLVSQLTSLQTETKYGRFRGTVMQTKTIPGYLQRWEKLLFERYHSKHNDSNGPPKLPHQFSREKAMFGDFIYSPTRFGTPKTVREILLRHFMTEPLPEQPSREEPFEGAWLEEGDRVEGLFKCNHDEQLWFPGTITAAIASSGAYDVAYDDGDFDEALDADCVRRPVDGMRRPFHDDQQDPFFDGDEDEDDYDDYDD